MFLCLAQTPLLVCASLRLQMSPLTDACISRQLHRQPEHLLLHQRQRPALLQESQEPVSVSRLIYTVDHRTLKAFCVILLNISGPQEARSKQEKRTASLHFICFITVEFTRSIECLY